MPGVRHSKHAASTLTPRVPTNDVCVKWKREEEKREKEKKREMKERAACIPSIVEAYHWFWGIPSMQPAHAHRESIQTYARVSERGSEGNREKDDRYSIATQDQMKMLHKCNHKSSLESNQTRFQFCFDSFDSLNDSRLFLIRQIFIADIEGIEECIGVIDSEPFENGHHKLAFGIGKGG